MYYISGVTLCIDLGSTVWGVIAPVTRSSAGFLVHLNGVLMVDRRKTNGKLIGIIQQKGYAGGTRRYPEVHSSNLNPVSSARFNML